MTSGARPDLDIGIVADAGMSYHRGMLERMFQILNGERCNLETITTKAGAMTFILPFIVTFAVLAMSPSAFCQSGGAEGDDISLFLGNMLPNQIEGVTDILPVFGGRYAFSGSYGALEIGGQNTHAMGVDFTTLVLDIRGEIMVAQGMSALIYGGPALNYYTQKDTSNRLTEYGLELGVGGMMLVSDTLWLRSDLKFMGGPGASLYLLFGIAFRTTGK